MEFYTYIYNIDTNIHIYIKFQKSLPLIQSKCMQKDLINISTENKKVFRFDRELYGVFVSTEVVQI